MGALGAQPPSAAGLQALRLRATLTRSVLPAIARAWRKLGMPELRKNDCSVLYYNPKEHRFLVVAVAQDGLALVEIGSPTPIPEAAFESEILNTLLLHLDAFPNNVYYSGHARHGSRETNRLFIREHLSVHVERLPSGDLVIKPLHHERGGYVGKSDEHIMVLKQNVHLELSSALRHAFEVAT